MSATFGIAIAAGMSTTAMAQDSDMTFFITSAGPGDGYLSVNDENGNAVNARGDKPNKHDILTGPTPQGQYSTAGCDTACSGWTSHDNGSAIVGHHDLAGLSQDRHMISWNSAHGSAGYGADALPRTGGDGSFYCFCAGG